MSMSRYYAEIQAKSRLFCDTLFVTADVAEFEHFYAQYADRLQRFVSGRCRSVHDAEEIASEAWMKAWKYRDSFRGESSFYTWLCRIAVNEVLTLRRARLAMMRDVDMVQITPAIATYISDGAPGAERELIAREAVFSLEELTGRNHEILHMRFVLGQETPQIAKELNINKNTVRTQIFRFRHEATTRLLAVRGVRKRFPVRKEA